MGELGPREERWRRVGHLTGGGHPLSQSTSVTAPPQYHTDHTTTLSCTTLSCTTQAQCLVESRVVLELVLGGWWFRLYWSCWERVGPLTAAAGQSCHLAPPPPPQTTHQLHLRSKSWKGSLAEKESTLVPGNSEKDALSQKSENLDFIKFCHLLW